jgi:hypothetical protein
MFPKDSAFKQTQSAMDQAAGMPPLRTPEQNREAAIGQNRAIVSIPSHEFENWLAELDALSDMRGGEAILDLKLRMQSFLP